LLFQWKDENNVFETGIATNEFLLAFAGENKAKSNLCDSFQDRGLKFQDRRLKLHLLQRSGTIRAPCNVMV